MNVNDEELAKYVKDYCSICSVHSSELKEKRTVVRATHMRYCGQCHEKGMAHKFPACGRCAHSLGCRNFGNHICDIQLIGPPDIDEDTDQEEEMKYDIYVKTLDFTLMPSHTHNYLIFGKRRW